MAGERQEYEVPGLCRGIDFHLMQERIYSRPFKFGPADRAMLDVPTKGVRDIQPAKEFRHLIMLTMLGPGKEVPVVAHQCIAENSQRSTFSLLSPSEFLTCFTAMLSQEFRELLIP